MLQHASNRWPNRLLPLLSALGAMAIVVFGIAPLCADVVTINTKPNIRDTTIFATTNPGATTDKSAGGQTQFYVGTESTPLERRGLLGFDIKDNVPAGATITDVQLSLVLTQIAGSGPQNPGGHPESLNIILHPLLHNWTEGTVSNGGGQGGAPAAGDTTWVFRSFSTVSWDAPGGDFNSSTISATTGVNGAAPGTVFNWSGSTGSQIVADVQSWLNNNDTNNFGWIFTNADTADTQTFRAFASRENTTFAGPQLQITYIAAVPEPGSFVLMSLAAVAGLAIRFRGRAN